MESAPAPSRARYVFIRSTPPLTSSETPLPAGGGLAGGLGGGRAMGAGAGACTGAGAGEGGGEEGGGEEGGGEGGAGARAVVAGGVATGAAVAALPVTLDLTGSEELSNAVVGLALVGLALVDADPKEDCRRDPSAKALAIATLIGLSSVRMTSVVSCPPGTFTIVVITPACTLFRWAFSDSVAFLETTTPTMTAMRPAITTRAPTIFRFRDRRLASSPRAARRLMTDGRVRSVAV